MAVTMMMMTVNIYGRSHADKGSGLSWNGDGRKKILQKQKRKENK